MKRPWKIGVVAGLVALVALGWLLLGHSNEPRYEGKPVSYWFKHYYVGAVVSEDGYYNGTDPDVALRGMGTNALPYLVRQALSTKKDTSFRTNYYRLLEKLPKSWHLPEFISRDDIRDEAVKAIAEINPAASAILPLVQMALDSTNVLLHSQALNILGNVKEGRELLVPCYKKTLHDADRLLRAEAVDFFAEIGPTAKVAIPDLIELLTSKSYSDDHVLSVMAASALGHLGPTAAPALPLMKERFAQEQAWGRRMMLATALCRIDARQTDALDFLVQSLKDSTKARASAQQLGLIGVNAAPAIPALMAALEGTNALVWIEAGPALKSMGAPKDLYLPNLEEKLKILEDRPRVLLALSLIRVDPENQAAQSALIDLIRTGSSCDYIAIDVWNESPRPPKEVMPVLEAALGSEKNLIREAAASVIKKIKEQDKAK